LIGNLVTIRFEPPDRLGPDAFKNLILAGRKGLAETARNRKRGA